MQVMASSRSKFKGFKRTASLLQTQIRKTGETRGFAVSRLLTHWPEIVGQDLAGIARPVDVKYGRQEGFGATLTVLTTGAQAPLLEMQKEKLREKVNAVYGYNAIARVRITQSSKHGFAEGKVSFQYRKESTPKRLIPDETTVQTAAELSAGVNDDALKRALEQLACNVITKAKR